MSRQSAGDDHGRNGSGRTDSRWLRGLAAVAVLSLIAAGCGGDESPGTDTDSTASDPAAEPGSEATQPDEADATYDAVQVTFPTGLPEGIWIMGGLDGFTEAVEEGSGGQISVEAQIGTALGPLTDHGPLVRDGIADITWVMSPLEVGQYPAEQWIAALAWMFENRPLVGDLQAYAATLEWGFSEEVVQQYRDQGMVPLVPATSGLANYVHLCTEPAGTLDQAQGKEPRVTSDIHGAEARAVGMTPTFIEAAETYEALQRGVIDCVLMHPRDLAGFGLLDIAQDVHVDPDASFSGHMSVGLFANADWWDSLPLAAQQDIWDALKGYIHEQMRFAFELDVEFFEDVAERGRIHEFGEDFQSALVDFQESRVDELRANPPSGWDEATAEASLDSFLSSTDRWLQIVEDLGYGDAPDTWGEYVEAGAGDNLDLTPWVDQVWEEIMLPQRPS